MATKAEKLLAKGQGLEKKGKPDKALEVYRDGCRVAPYDPEIWTARAELAATMGMSGEAAEALFHVSDLFARGGMPAEALKVARRVLELDKGHAGARRFVKMLEARLTPEEDAAPPPASNGKAGVATTPVAASDGEPRGGESPRAEDPRSTAAPAEPEPRPEPERSAPAVAPPEPEPPEPEPPEPSPRLATEPPVVQLVAEPALDEERTLRPPREPGAAREFRMGRITVEHALESLSLIDHVPSLEAEDGRTEIPLDDDVQAQVLRAVASTISSSPLLSELDSELIRILIDCGTLVHRAPDAPVFEQGEIGTSLYLILGGEVAVERDGKELARLRPGAFFGEMALLTNMARSATVRAVKPVDLLEISRQDVRTLIDRDPRVLKLLMRFFRARLVGTLLQTSPLFQAFTREERRLLVAKFRLRELARDFVVIRQGGAVEGLFLVLVGNLVVKNGDTTLATLGPGDVFGEMSLLEDAPASATVTTSGRAWLLLLGRDDFVPLVGAHPEVRERLAALAAERRARNEAALAAAPVREDHLEPV